MKDSSRQCITIFAPRNFNPLSLPPLTHASSSIPAASRSRQTMFVWTGILTFPPASVHASATSRAISCPLLSPSCLPTSPSSKTSLSPAIAIATTIAGCLIAPPMLFLTFLACAIISRLPTRTLPAGAHSPLVKHILTLSAMAPKSLKAPAPAATTSHKRAPSTCMRMP